MSTGYTYTGQYSNTADFGLMYYNARWYDPLGRFAQADTIVPAGVQGYDRYAYVNNNPVRYTDPSGHYACGDGEAHDCDGNGQDPNADPYESPEVDLEESFGLDNNSDFACTVYSCTVATPSVCPVGQTCWTVPDYWDLNPRHADYYSHVVNVYFISLVFSKDRYSQRWRCFGGWWHHINPRCFT